MNNLFKNIKLTIISFFMVFVLFSGMSVMALPEDEIEVVVKTPELTTQTVDPQEKVSLDEIKIADNVGSNITTENLEAFELQHKKTSAKKILFKFAVAIIWVVVSSVLIYFSLISYKNLSKKSNFGIQVEENTLNAPKNFKEAINLFLKKTKDE